MSKQDKKTPKEASSIFHNIMKASVTPKKADKGKKGNPVSKKEK